jgi:hypothetical protein
MTTLAQEQSAERSTAERAAARELLVIKQALAADDPACTLAAALERHASWLSFLLGVNVAAVRPYLKFRLAAVASFGLMHDEWQLLDAQENVLHIIRKANTP